jgi:hypothetical protein
MCPVDSRSWRAVGLKHLAGGVELGKVTGQARTCLAAAAILTLCLPLSAQLVQLRHWSGQGVAPVFEGYDTNPDGTFNMWFGYMNRNYEQEPDIPVGPNNQFQPGPVDRGQPTHFAIRRHKDIFSVTVPKDFGEQKLVWTLTVNGQTAQVVGTLNPVWMIDRKYTTRGANIENPYSNTPPVVIVTPTEKTVALGEALALAVSATDDGRPLRNGKPIGMTMEWEKYRGPGDVAFQPAKGKIADGKGETSASFSEPGEYILQLVVDDGSGEVAGNFGYHCCWTNVNVKVVVKGADHASSQR